ncbi:MAG: ROK family protein [Bacteroidaceae bacterium]|jgi:glucokinase|nr:ROK family protein [Bacteroidaceae bacterium]
MKKYVIGVDLGGTNTVFGVVDKEGNIVADASIKTQKYNTAEDFVKAGVECLKPLIERVGGIDTIQGIGIGAPNGNYYNGTIEFAPNLIWGHDGIVPLAKMFSEGLGGIGVKLTNDANAAAMGEMAYGVAQGMKNFIVITLGTGVGSGIVINGQLVYGCDGFAGELGHVVMVPGEEGRTCGCGRRGCLEAYCSATGMVRTAREMLQNSDEKSLLRDKPADQLEALDINIAANKGDRLALEVYERTGKMLGEACSNFTAFSSPEAYIFFGGVCHAGELIMKPIRESYDKNVMNIFKGKAKFLISGLMDKNAAVLGASALGWEV